MMKKYPKISVVTITYGHEDFIIETIKSVLMQKYLGDIEFIIANDRSPDNTDAIVRDYFQHHPAPSNFDVKYIQHEINKGMMPNFIWALRQGTGKYIALCEGDDYWTDPIKLQKQCDFLEKNDDYSLCFHSSKIMLASKNQLINESQAEERVYRADEILLTKVAHTASFVFKNNLINFNILLNKVIFGGDVMLALLLADKGDVFGMQDYMSVYRKHDGGVTNISDEMQISHQKRMVNQYLFMRKNINSVSPITYRRKLFDYEITVAMLYKKDEKYFNALAHTIKALTYRPYILYKMILKPFKKLK